MSHIISSLCIGEKDGSCIEVCPVDCISEGEDQMYINPDTCIDCGLCLSVCPVSAIFDSEESASKFGQSLSVKKNYEFFGKKFQNS
jgi:NAD-dependent dihydropyrimidine dehydrogenase PreA subunit